MKFRGMNGTLIPAEDAAHKYALALKPNQLVELHPGDVNPGSVSMLRTWRGWMSETAIAMTHYGCSMPLYVDSKGQPRGKRPYNQGDAHEQFTTIYLGTDSGGRRKTWSMSRKEDEVQASIGDRLHAMSCHQEWCSDRGIKLTIPRNSEYSELKEKQAA